MRKFALMILTLASLGVALSAGCASSKNPYAKAGYDVVEKDGRLYVFPGMNSGEYQRFKRTGELGKSVTRVGAGPNGMTVIAPDAATLDGYLGTK